MLRRDLEFSGLEILPDVVLDRGEMQPDPVPPGSGHVESVRRDALEHAGSVVDREGTVGSGCSAAVAIGLLV